MSKHQEWKLAQYLNRIRQALAKLTPAVSKPNSQRTSPETMQYTLDYVSRGSGLTAAQVNNKMYFKIFPTTQQALDPGDIKILIKGPKDTYGMAVIPPLLGKMQLIRQKVLGISNKVTLTQKALPLTHGANYLRSYGKNDMNKTYHIPKTKYDIEIEVESKPEHVKVAYIVPMEGKYEISITSRGQHIVGSPFNVTASNNIIGILERDSFCLEDGEEIDIVDVKTDRKAVLRIVDFVTEKMLLRENGALEKITSEVADMLISTDSIISETDLQQTEIITIDYKRQKFREICQKIKLMIQVCNAFKKCIILKPTALCNQTIIESNKMYLQKVIPDVVNSTLLEHSSQYKIKETLPRVIIPGSFSLLLQTNKIANEIHKPELETVKEIKENRSNDTIISSNFALNNPFHNCNSDFEQNIIKNEEDTLKLLSENVTQTSTEEAHIIPIKIVVETENECDVADTGCLIDHDILTLERPKTPVLKIITGQLQDRIDSPFLMPINDLDEENIPGSNEFINQGFAHVHRYSLENPNEITESYPTADFIIGAPVSLPPILKAPSPEPDMDSIILASNLNDALYKYEMKVQAKKREEIDDYESVFSTSMCDNKTAINCDSADIQKIQLNSIDNLTFHSIDSNLEDITQDLYQSQNNSFGEYLVEEYEIKSKDIGVTKKDTWDSAYVSIDDNNSSPDTNNDNSVINDIPSKQKNSHSDTQKREEFNNMGPAEREIWQTCKELGEQTAKINEDAKICKWEFKRPAFTPILEESDRSLSTGMKESIGTERIAKDDDPVTTAFAELNDIFKEYCPNTESNSLTLPDIEKYCSREVEGTIEQNVASVKSASEQQSDVMRQRIQTLEGTISRVQANVTESSSASRDLQNKNIQENNTMRTECSQNEIFLPTNREKTQFGEECHENLVLEIKKYWDEKIRMDEENMKTQKQYKKKKLSSKHLRHNDSLSKRKGKQIIKNFLSGGENKNSTNTQTSRNTNYIVQQRSHDQEELPTDVNLVEKWKKYWDERLIINNNQEIEGIKIKYQKHIKLPAPIEKSSISDTKIDISMPTQLEVKQEITEEVFKAFETSPKRFFGTSRKQIMNKIDSFLGKPNTRDEEIKNEIDYNLENGIVSNRVSLFHEISGSGKVPRSIMKRNLIENNNEITKVLHSKDIVNDTNITDTENIFDSTDYQKNSEEILNKQCDTVQYQKKEKNEIAKSTNSVINIKELYETYDQNNQKTDNKICEIRTKVNNVGHQNILSKKIQKVKDKHKLAASKSEMDIFNKVTSNNSEDDSDKYKSCEELPKINVKNYISLYETVSNSKESESMPRQKQRLKNASLIEKQNTETENIVPMSGMKY